MTYVLTRIKNHHYPFGLKYKSYHSDEQMYAKDGSLIRIRPVPPLFTTSCDYKYNGKEYQEELGLNMYDYIARYYDPKFSIWLSVDPLAEKYPSWSPYCYTMNNPINFIDPDGRAVAAPPRNGIKQFIDNSGVYHWDASRKQYEHYTYTDSSREHYSFSGYYKVNSSSRAVGNASYINGQTTTITEPSFSEKARAFGFEMSANLQAYQGEKGFYKFGDDLSKSSAYVKIGSGIVAIGSVATLQPEGLYAAELIYTIGDHMDNASTLIQIHKDYKNNKNTNVVSNIGLTVTNEIINNKFEKFNEIEKVSKIITKVSNDVSVDQIKNGVRTKEENKD